MTGLLYLIVVVMWGAVLFPIFLKKHDQQQIRKSVGLTTQLTELKWQKRVAPTPRQQAFIRRRRVLMTLLTATVLFALGGLSGLFSLAWVALPIVLLVGFVSLAIKNGAKFSALPDMPVATSSAIVPTATQTQATVALPLTPQVQAEVAKPTTWQPVEPPLPSYVTANRATAVPRALDAQRPWTGQDMVEHATKLRKEHAERVREAHKRLEEARALSMEKARRAALAMRPASEESQTSETSQAVNE